MKVRGALHAHTDLSHDGTLTVRQLTEWYKGNGYHFVAITEHSQDMNLVKVEKLRAESVECSSVSFCVIPGIEYTCAGRLHIPGIGVTELIASDDPVTVANEIRKHDGFSILAHPRRVGWRFSTELLSSVDAVEFWNVGYDGKYVPSTAALDAFPLMKRVNPKLLAVASHDLHRTVSFYDVGIEMDVDELSPSSIIERLRKGEYSTKSRFFDTDSSASLSWFQRARVRILSWNFVIIRYLRKQILRLEYASACERTEENQN